MTAVNMIGWWHKRSTARASAVFPKYGDESLTRRDCFVAPLLATTCPKLVVASEAKQSHRARIRNNIWENLN